MPTDLPQVSWHRGGGENFLGASRAAFCDAAERGAENIEVDVRQCADGTLVCVHDGHIETLGAVNAIYFSELNAAQRDLVLTLEQFCDDLDDRDPQRRCRLHFDLKARGYELASVDYVVSRGRELFVTTSELSSVRLLRRQRRDIATYLTIGRSTHGVSPWRAHLVRAGDRHPIFRIRASRAVGIAVHQALASSSLRRWCRVRDIPVCVWTVDADSDLTRWLASDVAVVTTNRPMRALELRS